MKTIIKKIFLAILFLAINHSINAQCQVSITTDNMTVCVGDMITLTAELDATNSCDGTHTFTYEWSTSDTGESINVIVDLGMTIYRVTLTDDDSNDTSEATITITGVAPQNAEIEPIGPFCSDNTTATTLSVTSGSLAGGIFHGQGVTGPLPPNNNYSFIPSDASGGNNEITYIVTDGPCPNIEVTTTIMVDLKPIINFPSVGPLCVDGDPVTLNASVTNIDNVTGEYDGDGLTDNQFNPSNAGIGTHIITYSYTNGECVTSSSINITVVGLPTITTCNDGALTFCKSDGACTLTGVPSGGSFSGNGSGIVNGQLIPGNVPANEDYVITYTVDGCANSITVHVYDNPTPEIVAVNSLCKDADCVDLTLVNGNFSGGMFSGDGVINNQFCPSSSGVSTMIANQVNYTFIDENSCLGADMMEIIVNPLPNITIGSNEPICEGATLSFEENNPGNVEWEWSGVDGFESSTSSNSIDDININLNGPYTVTVTDGNGCRNTQSKTFDIISHPVVEFSDASTASACYEHSATLYAEVVSTPPLNSTTNYIWEKKNASIGDWQGVSINNASITLVISETVDVRVKIYYTDSEGVGIIGCESEFDEHKVKLVDTPDPVIFDSNEQSNNITVCQNQQSLFYNDRHKEGGIQEWSISIAAPVVPVEDSMIQGGELYFVHWPNTIPDNPYTVTVIERVGDEGSTCADTATIKVTVVEGTAPDPAKIFFSPVNNILVYNDPTVTCYQWGYYDKEDRLFEELEGERFQSYVAESDYEDEKYIYWCKVWNGDCDNPICATTVVYRGDEGEPPVIIEESKKFVLYPNPNSGVFKLEVNQLLYDATYDIEIVNTLGQVVYEQTESTRGYDLDLNIDMGNQAAGVYYMALYYQGYLKKITPFVVHPH